jgi:hypothetical protein
MIGQKTLFADHGRMILRVMSRGGQLSGLLFIVACSGGTSSDTAATAGTVNTPPPVAAIPATPTTATAGSSVPTAAPRNPSTLGINVSSVDYFSGERSFSNLLVGGSWVDPNNGWNAFASSRIDSAGYLTSLGAGEIANLILTPPAATMAGTQVRIHCSYTGTGSVDVQGTLEAKSAGDHAIDFTWPALSYADQRVWLQLKSSAASDPVRNLDCRESGVPSTQLFADEFIESMKPFGVIRFLDWSGTNGNATFRWIDRRVPGALVQAGAQGVAIEHMVALVNKTGASPWFNIPWNSDDSYVRNFAQYVHDNIPAGRAIYVEFSNEVWNYSFPTTHQAEQEGLSEGLSSNAFEAALRRYAEKASWAMKIWTEVFSDRSADLVRVVGAQHSNPWTASTILSYRDTAKQFDALTTAPYFGHSLFDSGETNAPALLQKLTAQATEAVTTLAGANKAIAQQYNKRYIAYEAGQHLINAGNSTLVAALNRDGKMYDIYRSYMASWRTNVGDVMVLYSSTSPITSSGAWGIREFAGQPLAAAPKRRAVLDDAANWIK